MNSSATPATNSSSTATGNQLRASTVLLRLGKIDGRLDVLEATTEKSAENNTALYAAVKELKELKKIVGEQGKAISAAGEENRKLREEVTALVKRFADKEAESSNESTDDESTDEESERIITKSEREKLQASMTAFSDISFKELTRYSIAQQLGVAKLSSKTLPWYPDNEDKATWPRITGTDDPVLRFRWEESWDHKDNYYSIRMVMAYMKRHGPSLVPAAATAIKNISDEDHQKRVAGRIIAIQKQLREDGFLGSRGERIEQPAVNENPGLMQEDDGAGIKAEAKKKRATQATLISRARGKLDVRKRKRQNLRLDSPYLDAKYDAAFTAKLMSDDEDEYDEDNKKTGQYVSHAPLYRSKEMVDLLAAVDAAPDPDRSSRYVHRIRGEAVEVPPKKSTKMENKARRWMVDEEWLKKEENLEFDSESRVVNSGKAWGDEEDPEVAVSKREKIKQEKQAMVEKKRKVLEGDKTRSAKKAKRGRKNTEGACGGKKRAPISGSSAGGADHDDDDQVNFDA